jgi:hypothetical protein
MFLKHALQAFSILRWLLRLLFQLLHLLGVVLLILGPQQPGFLHRSKRALGLGKIVHHHLTQGPLLGRTYNLLRVDIFLTDRRLGFDRQVLSKVAQLFCLLDLTLSELTLSLRIR